MDYHLADDHATPPTSSSYWVVPHLLLAGAYPGDPDPIKHWAKVRALLDAGIRMFVNLMEEDETNYAGEPFVPYQDLARQFCPDTRCWRYPIRDLSAPTHDGMTNILDAIDAAMAAPSPVYVHCWGGVGRTGTVIGCWLLRHELAEPANVLSNSGSRIASGGTGCRRSRRNSSDSSSSGRSGRSVPGGRIRGADARVQREPESSSTAERNYLAVTLQPAARPRRWPSSEKTSCRSSRFPARRLSRSPDSSSINGGGICRQISTDENQRPNHSPNSSSASFCIMAVAGPSNNV
jgi:hypothetical protein